MPSIPVGLPPQGHGGNGRGLTGGGRHAGTPSAGSPLPPHGRSAAAILRAGRRAVDTVWGEGGVIMRASREASRGE